MPGTVLSSLHAWNLWIPWKVGRYSHSHFTDGAAEARERYVAEFNCWHPGLSAPEFGAGLLSGCRVQRCRGALGPQRQVVPVRLWSRRAVGSAFNHGLWGPLLHPTEPPPPTPAAPPAGLEPQALALGCPRRGGSAPSAGGSRRKQDSAWGWPRGSLSRVEEVSIRRDSFCRSYEHHHFVFSP